FQCGIACNRRGASVEEVLHPLVNLRSYGNPFFHRNTDLLPGARSQGETVWSVAAAWDARAGSDADRARQTCGVECDPVVLLGRSCHPARPSAVLCVAPKRRDRLGTEQ